MYPVFHVPFLFSSLENSWQKAGTGQDWDFFRPRHEGLEDKIE
jgi:hypothetical protein